jgi:hypothetical protein
LLLKLGGRAFLEGRDDDDTFITLLGVFSVHAFSLPFLLLAVFMLACSGGVTRMRTRDKGICKGIMWAHRQVLIAFWSENRPDRL